jgi:hypothetical protein
MDHVLTEHGLRLTYLCDPHDIDELDQDRILEDMSDDTPGGDPLPWFTRHRLVDYDHLVLVTDRGSGRYLAFLGANNGTTPHDDFLMLRSAFVATEARGHKLMRRMIAFALLRIGGSDTVPSAIVVRTNSPACYKVMRGMAQRFSGAAFLPDPDSVTINFHTAILAQRIAREISPNYRVQVTTGIMRRSMTVAAPTTDHVSPLARVDRRMLVLLDLRGRDEAAIMADARRIYRER